MIVPTPKLMLRHLEIEGFRGYNTPFRHDLTKSITALFGENGVGKSSTLMAIEWCLFGDVEYLSHLEGRTRDELVNQFSSTGLAKVTLDLVEGTRTYRVSRAKKAGSTKDDLRLTTPEGELNGQLAENKLFQLLEITLDDFVRAIYLHQESVKGLLVEDMSSRDEGLDRLFGLERMRNIIESVPITKIRGVADELESKKDTLSRKIEGAVQQCQLDLNRLQQKASGLGVSDDEISMDLALKIGQSIVQSLYSLSSKYQGSFVAVEPPTELAQFDSFERKVKGVLREFQSTLIGTSKINELHAERARLENLLRKYNENVSELASYEGQLADVVAKFGPLDELPARRARLAEQLAQSRVKRMEVDDRSRLINDAIKLLKSHPSDSCPLCGQDIDAAETLKDLESESEKRTIGELKLVDQKILDLQTEDRDLELAQESIARISDRKKSTVTAVESNVWEVNSLIGSTSSGRDELVSSVGNRLGKLDKEIREFDAVYKERANSLEGLRSDLEKVVAIGDVLRKDAEFSEINSHFKAESDEIQELETAISELRSFETNLTSIVRTAGEVQAGLAKAIISTSQEDIESIYNRLCRHPMYDRMRVDVKAREARGLVRNSYSIKAYNSKLGSETFVSTRFSTGQMNSVAIAICLALARRLPLRLGFLILDDPSQSLDTDHKKALAKILQEVSAEKQVILSTHDEELLRMVRSDVGDIHTVEFSKWSESGPRIEVR